MVSRWRFYLLYAQRGMRRNSRRTVLMVMTIGLSIATMILAHAFAVEVFRYWITSTTESGAGDAQIHRSGAWKESLALQPQFTFEGADHQLFSWLNEQSNDLWWTRRLKFDGLVSSGQKAVYFAATGIDPVGENLVSPRLVSYFKDRHAMLTQNDIEKVVIGRGLAESLAVDVGQTVKISAYTIDQQLNSIDATVAGIIDYPDSMVSKRLIYLHLSQAQALLALEGASNEIAVKFKSDHDSSAWIDRCRSQTFGHECRGWWDIYPPIKKVEQIWIQILIVACGLLFLSSTLALLTTIFLMVTERTVEIGVLGALGARRYDVLAMFVAESSLLGAFGTIVGCGIGSLGLLAARTFGIQMVNPLFPGYLSIYPGFHPEIILMVATFAVILSGLSAIPGALRATKVEPVIAFRGQLT